MRLEVRQNERGREFASLTRWNRGKRDEVRGEKTKISSLF
jgi:hypothetical protein